MEALFDGAKVIDKNGDFSISTLAGKGKYVGLYFSAHWCPPCRGFTPELKKFYEFMKTTPEGANMDIVFISSDRDQEAFEEYFREMPWLALDFKERDRKADLSKMFIVLNESGEVVNAEARNEVAKGEGNWSQFPWA